MNQQVKETQQLEGANLGFTCDLWSSRCMTAGFTMTGQWIEIRGDDLSAGWMAPHRVLGVFLVQDESIDYRGKCLSVLSVQQRNSG